MTTQRNSPLTAVRWISWLFAGLMIESLCLGAGMLFWMSSNDIPFSALAIFFSDGESQELGRATPFNPLVLLTQVLPPSSSPGVSMPDGTPAASLSPESQLPNFTNPPPGKIVFTCFDGEFDQICLMNADGTGRLQLTFERATSFYAAFSPTGEEIYFSFNRDGNFEIYRMDIDGSDPFQITDNIGNLFAPDVSPKGNRIAFTLASGNLQSIWVMRLGGGNIRPLIQSGKGDIDPVWSFDASQVAFTSKLAGETQLFIASSEGTKIHQVIKETFPIGGRLDWSNDNSTLAVYAGPNGDHDIYIVSPDGSGLQRLTDGGDNLAPSFSPDSAWLAFTSYRDGNNEIYIMELNTRLTYRLTFTRFADWQPNWGP